MHRASTCVHPHQHSQSKQGWVSVRRHEHESVDVTCVSAGPVHVGTAHLSCECQRLGSQRVWVADIGKDDLLALSTQLLAT